MITFLQIVFVIIANIICCGMLSAGVVFVFAFIRSMITDKSEGRNPHNPNTGSGMRWG